jgi:hypothetical protein
MWYYSRAATVLGHGQATEWGPQNSRAPHYRGHVRVLPRDLFWDLENWTTYDKPTNQPPSSLSRCSVNGDSRFFWDLEFGSRVNVAREGPITPEGPTLSTPRASAAKGTSFGTWRIGLRVTNHIQVCLVSCEWGGPILLGPGIRLSCEWGVVEHFWIFVAPIKFSLVYGKL